MQALPAAGAPPVVTSMAPRREPRMSPERTLNIVIMAVVAVILIVLLLMLLGVIASPF
jgi:hypothetical protein